MAGALLDEAARLKMVDPAEIEAVSFGAVLRFHLEIGVEEQVIVLGK